MAEPTNEQRKAISAFVKGTLSPLIEEVLTKKLAQAATFIADELLGEAERAVNVTDAQIEAEGENGTALINLNAAIATLEPVSGVGPAQAPSKDFDVIMRAADLYWEASTAARYRVRGELEQIVRSALGVPAFDQSRPCDLERMRRGEKFGAGGVPTMCMRCKNPHHACDHGMPAAGVAPAEAPSEPLAAGAGGTGGR